MSPQYPGGNGADRSTRLVEHENSLPAQWPWVAALVAVCIALGFIIARLPPLDRAPVGWVPLYQPQVTSWDYAGFVEYEGLTVEHVAAWYANALGSHADVSTECEAGDTCFTVLGAVGSRQVQVEGSGFTALQTVLVHIGSLSEEE
jgi:hypothetical protein